MRKLHSLLLTLTVLAATAWSPPAVLAGPVFNRASIEGLARVVCIELIDTDAANADRLGIARDGDNIKDTLETSFGRVSRGDRLIRIRIEGSQLTPQRVLQTLQELKGQGRLRPCDTLLVFYSGHGSWRRDDHVLTMAHGKLYRTDLLQAMVQTGCRLRILLTDCCSSNTEGRGGDGHFRPHEEPVPPVAMNQANEPEWSTVRDLLLRHQGTVDITAAIPGTPAFGNPVAGGNFTFTLLVLMRTPVAELDTNGDGQVDWEEIFRKLQHGAENQEAHSFSLPKSPKPSSPISPGPRSR